MVDTPIATAPTARQRRSAAWLEAKAPWAGVAVASMWLAVLFVGVFGGDIVTTNGVSQATGDLVGNGSRVPSVIVVAFFALIGTIFVARWGFREPPAKD
jgi:hypothetical protein